MNHPLNRVSPAKCAREHPSQTGIARNRAWRAPLSVLRGGKRGDRGMNRSIWFWQRIVSPHMAGLVARLSGLGVDVTYVAEREMSAERTAQGWRAADVGGARLIFAPDDAAAARLATEAPADAVHICQGLRANGVVASAQKTLATLKRDQWVVIEAVDESAGLPPILKRLTYAWLIRTRRSTVRGFLANGYSTAGWLMDRGARPASVFPFAYFLPSTGVRPPPPGVDRPFRFIFVGQFIPRKRLDLLIDAAAALDGRFEMIIIGSGPLEDALKAKAAQQLGDRMTWIGQRPLHEVSGYLASADCLVLPSRHDGWGAVVSEALLAGIPAICSDRCGSATAVYASGRGEVFPSGDRPALTAALGRALRGGPPSLTDREETSRWAHCLTDDAGAAYLTRILAHADGEGPRPAPPWSSASSA